MLVIILCAGRGACKTDFRDLPFLVASWWVVALHGYVDAD